MIWAVSLSTTKLISRRVTPVNQLSGIRSLGRFGNLVRPLAHPVLYPHQVRCNASPKAISGRTSYLRVRLAFHLYPQLIHVLFNALWFGPPRSVTFASPWPWIGHPVSGLLCATIRPFETRFPYGSVALRLNLATHSNSQARSTKSTRSLPLPLLVNTGFQVLFHSPPGVLFTFPSRYYSLSVTK